MVDTKIFDEIAKRLKEVVPESVQRIEKDLEEKFREVLQAAFSKFELVTREEFDTQVKVLSRTRKKLEQLEKQFESFVAELKSTRNSKSKKTKSE